MSPSPVPPMPPHPPTRLQREHQRLFRMPPTGAAGAQAGDGLLDAEGRVRALVLRLGRPADWSALAPLWQGVQADWGWPAPAIAITGADAFELWFSLQEPLARAEAADLLRALGQRYLHGVKPERWQVWPDALGASPPPALPPHPAAPERWAAFVAPDLPAVFEDDPSLDFEPGAEAQADLLTPLRSVSPAQWRAAVDAMAAEAHAPDVTNQADTPSALPSAAPTTVGAVAPSPSLVGPFADPSAFLRAVMNEPSAPLGLRVEAAKALLGAGA